MFKIKKIITVIAAIMGSSIGLLFMAFINWAFSLSLTFTNVFFIGVIGGAVLGVLGTYLLTIYLMNKAKRFVQNKFMNTGNRLTISKRV